MRWSFLMDLVEKLIPLFVGVVLEPDPSARIEGMGVELTLRISFYHVIKIRERFFILLLTVFCFSQPIVGRAGPLTLRIFLDQFLKRGDGFFVSLFHISISPL